MQRILSSDAASVIDVRFPSKGVGGFVSYRAIVPSGTAGEKLPVLYLLHGANSDPAELMDHSDVLKLAIAERLIVVMPNGGLSYYTNAKHKSNSHWEDAIRMELPHDVEARFPVLGGRQHTGVAGISMGGYAAVKFALKHPEQYGFAGDLSGALDITRRSDSLKRWGQTWRIWTIFGVSREARKDEDVFDLLHEAAVVTDTAWFLSCGHEDPLRSVNERFAQQMRKRNSHVIQITTPGGHDWQSWKSAMPELFRAAHESLR